MIECCIHIIYKKCSKESCHCKDNKVNGSYTTIVIKVDTKSKLTYINRLDIIDKGKAYKVPSS